MTETTIAILDWQHGRVILYHLHEPIRSVSMDLASFERYIRERMQDAEEQVSQQGPSGKVSPQGNVESRPPVGEAKTGP